MATNKPRYSITVDEQMFKEIEDFRFTNRYQTRSQATSALIRLGLDALANRDKVGKEATAIPQRKKTAGDENKHVTRKPR